MNCTDSKISLSHQFPLSSAVFYYFNLNWMKYVYLHVKGNNNLIKKWVNESVTLTTSFRPFSLMPMSSIGSSRGIPSGKRFSTSCQGKSLIITIRGGIKNSMSNTKKNYLDPPPPLSKKKKNPPPPQKNPPKIEGNLHILRIQFLHCVFRTHLYWFLNICL